jgi:hypothetical protein
MKKLDSHYSWIMIAFVVFLVSVACNLFSNPLGNVAEEAKQLATQVDFSQLETTMEAISTEVQESGLQETVQAMVTTAPEDLGDLQATAEAVQEGFGGGETPADIPVVEGVTDNFYGSKDVVSYFTAIDFSEVLDYYQQQMPLNGWEEKQSESIIAGDTAVLHYEKPDRTAIVTLSVNPVDGKTIVMVTILEK